NDLPGGARSPYEDNGAGFQNIAYSVLSPGHIADPVPGSNATYNLSGATTFSILWGSPDNYNHLSVYDTSNNLVQITNIANGTDLNGSQLPCFAANACTNLHWVWLTFTGQTALSKVVLSDDGTAAFEYGLNLPGGDTSPTPIPGALLLFGSVLAGG